VIGGQVVMGQHGAAGEIGYNLRAVSDVGLALEDRVPLEWMVSARALGKRATSAAGSGRELSAADAFAASDRNRVLDDVIDQFVAELGFHLVNLANSIDPVRIAVGGGMTGSWERLRPGLDRALRAGVPYPPQLVLAEFPFDAPLIGAVALAVEAAPARLGSLDLFHPQQDTSAQPGREGPDEKGSVPSHLDGRNGPQRPLNNAHTTKD
jgi:glucokinase